MDADLDLLLISVYCTADDLLPERPRNARRRLSDAEVVTLCVAQVLVGIPSDRRFLRAARRQLGHLFPQLPSQDALHKRRARLAETIEWLVGVFAERSPGSEDDLVLLDSTPVECGRSLETARRSRLAEIAGYGYSRSHSRWFWGMRLHLACAPDGTPRAAALAAADRPEREVALTLLPQALRGGETVVCDKGYAGHAFAEAVARLGATVLRPPRRTEAQTGPHLAPIRQRIESVFFTCKDLLTLERHGARTPRNLHARIALRLLALAACIHLNHKLGRPSRAIANYTA
jgi:Transposase DDE domain